MFVVLIALVAATAAVKPEFLNLQNLRDVLLNVSIIGLLTAGMTVVMLMRHIDLSVASVVGVSAYSVGSLFVMFPHMPIVVAMLAGIVIGLVIGAVNGTLDHVRARAFAGGNVVDAVHRARRRLRLGPRRPDQRDEPSRMRFRASPRVRCSACRTWC